MHPVLLRTLHPSITPPLSISIFPFINIQTYSDKLIENCFKRSLKSWSSPAPYLLFLSKQNSFKKLTIHSCQLVHLTPLTIHFDKTHTPFQLKYSTQKVTNNHTANSTVISPIQQHYKVDHSLLGIPSSHSLNDITLSFVGAHQFNICQDPRQSPDFVLDPSFLIKFSTRVKSSSLSFKLYHLYLLDA